MRRVEIKSDGCQDKAQKARPEKPGGGGEGAVCAQAVASEQGKGRAEAEVEDEIERNATTLSHLARLQKLCRPRVTLAPQALGACQDLALELLYPGVKHQKSAPQVRKIAACAASIRSLGAKIWHPSS